MIDLGNEDDGFNVYKQYGPQRVSKQIYMDYIRETSNTAGPQVAYFPPNDNNIVYNNSGFQNITPEDLASFLRPSFNNKIDISIMGKDVTSYDLTSIEFKGNVWGIEVRMLVNGSIRIGNTYCQNDLDRLAETVKELKEDKIKYKLITV